MQHLNQLQNDRQHVIRNYDKKGTRLMTRAGGDTTTTTWRKEKAHPSTRRTPTTDYYNINRDILAQDTEVQNDNNPDSTATQTNETRSEHGQSTRIFHGSNNAAYFTGLHPHPSKMKRPHGNSHDEVAKQTRLMKFWKDTYDGLPETLKNYLRRKNINDTLTVSEMFREYMDSQTDFIDRTATAASEFIPEHRRDTTLTQYKNMLAELYEVATRTPGITQVSYHVQTYLESQPAPPPTVDITNLPKAVLHKWREWRPRNLPHDGLTHMKDIENQLRILWVNRSLQLLKPYHEHLPSFNRAWELPSRDTELRHLYADIRWPTIRLHTTVLEKELTLHQDWIPTTDNMLHRTLNEIMEREIAPSNCDKILRCAHWHEQLTGMDQVSQDDALHRKARAIKQEMQTEHYQVNHQAPTMSFQAHRLTELGTEKCRTRVHRDVMTHACFLLTSASRYADGQHAARSKLEFLERSTEVDTWSTKTTGKDKAKTHHRLIAVHNAYTDTEWWKSFKRMHEDWDKMHENANKRDFLFPTPNKNLDGYYLTPCSNGKFLRLYRQALAEMEHYYDITLDPPATRLFLSSFRVTGPDEAMQCGISSQHRRNMADWAHESTTDIYVRNRGEILYHIWNQMKAYFVTDVRVYTARKHPINLCGGDTEIDIPQHILKASPVAREIIRKQRPPPETNKPEPAFFRPGPSPWETELTVYYVIYPYRAPRRLHTHWTTKSDHDAGIHQTMANCLWNYPINEFEVIKNKAQYDSRVDKMIKCKNCWAKIAPPEGWTDPDAELAMEDDDDLSGQSVGHDESDKDVNSEEECCVVMEPPALPTPTTSTASSSSTPG